MPSITDHKTKISLETQEIRKKIQLSEGQSKAFYEESESEKKVNKEKVNKLRSRIKLLHLKLHEARLGRERAVEEALQSQRRKRQGSAPLSARVVKSEETIKISEYRLHDYVKRLNFLQHTSKQKEERLTALNAQLEEIGPQRAKKEQQIIRNLKREHVKLENEMDRIFIQLQEAEGIKRQYLSMVTSLKGDEATQRTSMEVLCLKLAQEKEALKLLKESRRNAERTRDDLRSHLHEEEDLVFEARREREKKLDDYRKKVDEKGTSEISTIPNRKMSLLRTPTQRLSPTHGEEHMDAPDGINQEMERFFHLFSKLKDTLGVTSFEEVMERLKAQKSTRDHLQQMHDLTLLDLKSFKQEKEQLQQELHKVKYAATEDSVKLDGAYEELESTKRNLLETKSLLQESADDQLIAFRGIRATFELIKDNLQGPEKIIHEKHNELSLEYLLQLKDFCVQQVNKCLKDIVELDYELEEDDEFDDKIPQLSAAIETFRSDKGPVAITPENLRVNFPSGKGNKQGGPQADEGADSGEEEEAIARRYLKKQAQMVVEAKSRKRNRPVSSFRS